MGFLNTEKVLKTSKIDKKSLDLSSGLQSENDQNLQKSSQSFIISPQIRGFTKSDASPLSGGHMSLRATFKRPDIKENTKILQVRKPFIYEGRVSPLKIQNEVHQEHAEKSLMRLESSGNEMGYDEKSGVSYVWIESESISNNDVK